MVFIRIPFLSTSHSSGITPHRGLFVAGLPWLRLLVGIPEFTIGLDILHRRGWIDVKIVAAELFVEAECGLVATEVEQTVKGTFDVAGVGDGRAQDGFHDRGVFPYGLLVYRVEA